MFVFLPAVYSQKKTAQYSIIKSQQILEETPPKTQLLYKLIILKHFLVYIIVVLFTPL